MYFVYDFFVFLSIAFMCMYMHELLSFYLIIYLDTNIYSIYRLFLLILTLFFRRFIPLLANGKDEQVNLGDATMLTDNDGRVWSGNRMCGIMMIFLIWVHVRLCCMCWFMYGVCMCYVLFVSLLLMIFVIKFIYLVVYFN